MPLYLRLSLKSFFKQKSKAVLIVFSLLFCLVTVGTLMNSKSMLNDLLEKNRETASIADLTYHTGSFDKSLEFLNSVEGIKHIEAKMQMSSRAKIDGEYSNLLLAVKPEESYNLNTIQQIEGSPLHREGIWVEKTSAELTGVQKKDLVRVTLPHNTEGVTFSTEGVASDPSRIPAKYSGTTYGYITEKAVERLGMPLLNNIIQIKLDESLSEKEKAESAGNIRKLLEENEITVYISETSSETFFIRESVINSLLNLFLLLGSFSFVLGFVLIVHLFYRILAEDRFSLSVQKVIGAKNTHIWKQYLVLIGVLGVLLSSLSIPLSGFASKYLVSFLCSELNLEIGHPPGISMNAAAILMALSFIIPFFGALVPIRKLIVSPISEGLKSSTLTNKKGRKQGRFFHISLLSFRNAYSKKIQIFMNILMLSFGGGIIISSLTLNQSLQSLMEDMSGFWKHDVEWYINSPQPEKELTSFMMDIEGVIEAEGWTKRNTEIIESPEKSSNSLLYSLPSDSEFINPHLLEGNWLNESQPNKIVINSELSDSQGIHTGDSLDLQIGKSRKAWRIAGVVESSLSGPSIFMTEEGYSKWTGMKTVNRLMVTTQPNVKGDSILQKGESHLGGKGVVVEGSDTVEDMNSRPEEIISLVTLTIFLIGILFTLVGIFNLMIAVSINIYERTKEIGILRSLGCSNSKVYQLFIWENTLITLLSWGLATAISYPLNWLLGRKIGESLLHFSIEPDISAAGSMYWLGASLFIGLIASILPVRKALKVSVKELL